MKPTIEIFSLFGNCLPVKGSKRSVICDLYRNRIETIPNSLFDILTKDYGKSFQELSDLYGIENEIVLAEYFDWLIKEEFGFGCENIDEFNAFPKIDDGWDVPFPITNAIIDLNENTNFDMLSCILQLDKLGVPHLQIRSFALKPLDYFSDLFNHIEKSRIKTIDIITPFNINIPEENIIKFCNSFLRVNSLLFYSSPFEKIDNTLHGGLTTITYTKYKLTNESHCGFIHSDFFSINMDNFTESQKHNTCLNRKISIHANGEIKNCPSMAKSYGNIKNTTLQEALEKQGFKDVWFINKDKISVCKDCEFRHICTDCRAYIENPEDIYSKPLKCGYNPYTAEWEEWSTNPLKQKAIDYYGLREIIVS